MGSQAAGKKLDMGKACIHFKTADDLALEIVGQIVAAVPADRWVKIAQDARRHQTEDDSDFRARVD